MHGRSATPHGRVAACGDWRYGYDRHGLATIAGPHGERTIVRGERGRPVRARERRRRPRSRYGAVRADGRRAGVGTIRPAGRATRSAASGPSRRARRDRGELPVERLHCIGRVDGPPDRPLAAAFMLDPTGTPVRSSRARARAASRATRSARRCWASTSCPGPPPRAGRAVVSARAPGRSPSASMSRLLPAPVSPVSTLNPGASGEPQPVDQGEVVTASSSRRPGRARVRVARHQEGSSSTFVRSRSQNGTRPRARRTASAAPAPGPPPRRRPRSGGPRGRRSRSAPRARRGRAPGRPGGARRRSSGSPTGSRRSASRRGYGSAGRGSGRRRRTSSRSSRSGSTRPVRRRRTWRGATRRCVTSSRTTRAERAAGDHDVVERRERLPPSLASPGGSGRSGPSARGPRTHPPGAARASPRARRPRP